MKTSIIEIKTIPEGEMLKLLLQNPYDLGDVTTDAYLTARKHIKEFRNLLLLFDEFILSGKFIMTSKKEIGDLLRIIRDCLFYGRRKKIINFSSIWIKRVDSEILIQVRMLDLWTPEDEEQFKDFIDKGVKN